MSLSQTEFVCQNEILKPLFFLIKNKASFTTKNFSQFQASSLRVLFIIYVRVAYGLPVFMVS